MGGRGSSSGANTKQVSVEEYLYKERISAIMQKSQNHLAENQGGLQARVMEALGAVRVRLLHTKSVHVANHMSFLMTHKIKFALSAAGLTTNSRMHIPTV